MAAALSVAERLLSTAAWYEPSDCYLDAWARNDDDLRRLADTFPGAQVTSYGTDGIGLPASVHLGVDTFVQVRGALRAWADITRGYVLWHNLKWPSVPELGLGEEYKYAELQIACNSHDIHCEEWAAEHTVFIHARPGDDGRAAWLAAQVGARVVGPPEFGW
ncbi:hypothetical protein [Streptomyces brasiliensis]|uniref:hypothetical protein n=1 Tax=Streptomyces brasiliensis TaxID=1954 RepID=UPI00166F9D24|nr:hypothetical protein [Streptomyces brasiliensis]